MIGPVSGTGRAMMASLQQAIQKGMPPDQAIQYVKSMATQGVAPLADLYAMMKQFERLKQQPVKPPQTPPTIRDELNMMEQQRMQAPAPMAQPMDQGLGAINAGQMENPSFAGGGIVAFDQGGPVGLDLDKMSTEQLKILTSDQDVELAKAATRELLQRSGYVAPQDYVDKYVSMVRAGVDELSGAPFIKFDNSRKFPAHMYDAEGNVRRSTETLAGIGGGAEVPSSAEMVRRIDPQAGEKFAAAQEGFRQLMPSGGASAETVAPTEGAPVDMMGSMFRAENPFATPDENTRDMMRLMSTTRTAESSEAEEAPRVPAQRDTARIGADRAAPREDEFSKFERERPDLEKIRAERVEFERASKTGRFSQADEEMAAFIKAQKEQYGASEKEARNNFWINAGASLMASKNPSFLAALGESVKANYGNLVGDLKALRKDQQALRLQEIQLQRAREQAIASGEERDIAKYERLYDRAEATNMSIAQTRADIREKIATRASNERIATMRAAGNVDEAAEMTARMRAAYGEKDPAKRAELIKAYEDDLFRVGKIRSALTAGGAESTTRERLAIAEAVAKRKEKSDYTALQRRLRNAKTEQEKAAIEAEMNRIEQAEINSVTRILSGGSNTGYVPTFGGMGGAGGTPTTSGWFD